jgi:hypothetical protein
MDLCIVTDFTGSMMYYLDALKPSIQEFIHIFKLCDDIDRISILGYSDYSERELIKWSGWKNNTKDLIPFINTLNASGGSDIPEAAKTAAFELINKIEKKTIVIWYTDAPPHTEFTGSSIVHYNKEKNALKENFDWVVLSNKLKDLNSSVWFLLPENSHNIIKGLYAHMSKITNGKTLLLNTINSNLIGTTTVGLILSIMGHKYDFKKDIKESFIDTDQNFIDENQINTIISNNNNIIKTKEIIININNNLNIIEKFNKDKDYKNKVYNVFEDILTPQLIKSLTYNPLFGTLWREICKDKSDPRRDIIVNKLSNVISNLNNAADKTIMQIFIEQSYNQSDQIQELIESCEIQFPSLIIDKNLSKLSCKDILEITRSCSPTALKQLCEILTNLKIVDHIKKQKYIPINMNNKDFFSCIPHLIVDGIMFSFRASIIMAMLIIYTGTDILLDKATEFIINNRGKWLITDQPENFSYEFIKFALRVDKILNNQLLTDNERNIYTNLHTIAGLKINANTNLTIKLPFTSSKTLRPDYKIECNKCHELRSFTIMDKNNICGLCLCDVIFPSINNTKSYWCECRTCKAHYAVEDIKSLNVVPKCHFCRNNIATIPTITCSFCQNNFISTNSSNNKNSWMCPICLDDEKTNPQEIEVNIKNYVSGCDQIFVQQSIWSLYENNIKMPTINYPTRFNNKIVLNVDDLKIAVNNWITLEKAEKGTCMICFNEMNKNKLYDVCDLKNCNAKACSDCLTQWYAEPKPGHLLNFSNIMCTFCRKFPTPKILKKYNKELCTLKKCDIIDHTWHYAWCIKCYHAKKYIEKQCAQDNIINIITNFICEDCKDTTNNIITKPCPKCGVMTEKSSGCDHITCTCGSHWCFNCSELSTSDAIYDHMWNKHGNIGLVVDRNDNYDYDDNDDY